MRVDKGRGWRRRVFGWLGGVWKVWKWVCWPVERIYGALRVRTVRVPLGGNRTQELVGHSRRMVKVRLNVKRVLGIIGTNRRIMFILFLFRLIFLLIL